MTTSRSRRPKGCTKSGIHQHFQPGFRAEQRRFHCACRTGSAGNGAYSLDAGITWNPFASQPAGANAGTVAVAADGSTILWSPSGTSAGFYSKDHGTTWTASAGLPSALPVLSDRVNSLKFYAFDNSAGALYLSTDGGATFAVKSQGLPAGGNLNADFAFEGDLWLTSGSGLYHSTNSGSSFTQTAQVQVAYNMGLGKPILPLLYPTLFIAGEVNNVWGIFASVDAGSHWFRINDDRHQYGWITVVKGDQRVFGRVYLGTNGRGVIYGDFEP